MNTNPNPHKILHFISIIIRAQRRYKCWPIVSRAEGDQLLKRPSEEDVHRCSHLRVKDHSRVVTGVAWVSPLCNQVHSHVAVNVLPLGGGG